MSITPEEKERWFIVRSADDCYCLGAVDRLIEFAPDHKKEWMGQTLDDVKPQLKEAKAKVYELLPDSSTRNIKDLFKLQ